MYESDPRTTVHLDGQFCRLCFNRTDDLCPLFLSPANIPNKALLHKIFDCTTITLSFRDDHDANICANCIVSIEAFFKYKAKCVENDRLLRKKRVSFFAGLGLAGGLDADGDEQTEKEQQQQQHQQQQSNGDAREQLLSQSKRRRLLEGANGLGEEQEVADEAGDPEHDTDRKRQRGNGGEELDAGRFRTVKQEPDEEEDERQQRVEAEEEEEEEDDEEYFNPNQFLAQETQIDEGAENETSSDGNGLALNNNGNGSSSNEDGGSSMSYERAWKTTEFAAQPGGGACGLRTLKITDYSNVTGKRGRAQRFEADLLAAGGSSGGSSASSLLAYHQQEAVFRELQRLNGLAVGGGVMGRMAMVVSPPGGSTGRSRAASAGLLEPTKKVQKFLDDGLRELIYNAGAPNPHYARDGGSTNFKVVKARFNSYNIIFDDNRFLRRNKSVSGLPKWYWACSVTGCPVKICSYAGRLFKTNELSHTHPPTEPDADTRYETIRPDPLEAEQLQRQLLLQQQQQHQAQQQRLLRQQQQQQLLRQRQIEQAQRRAIHSAALMAAAAVAANRPTEEPASDGQPTEQDHKRKYELRRAADGTEMVVYGGHSHGLIMTRKDGARVYRCTSVVGAGEERRACTDTVFLRADGRFAGICKEEQVDYEMELPEVPTSGGSGEPEEDEKRRRPQKIIVYEGYRYKYCHARPEGSFYWRCVQRHEKDCLASLQTKRNLEFLNVNDEPHNHEPPDPLEPHENAMLCEIRLPAKGEQEAGSTDFQLVKSGQKREFLIYKGYRYYFQYESKNGRRSYRCTMFKNCPAGAFLLPNSTIQEAKNFIHTHPPVEDMEKYITKDSLITSPIKTVQTATEAQATPAPPSTVDEGDPAAMSAWKAAQEAGSSAGSQSIEPLSKDPEVARRNGYRIIKNYKNKEIMIYLGWRYFEDYKKKSGGQVWRCSSHRLCRGSVHLFPDGSINFAKLVDHNHSPPKKLLGHSAMPGEIEALESLDGGVGGVGLAGGAYHRYIMHQGHRFRFATRKREGTIYWRCAMRLETKCPVSFHTREDSYELVSTRNHEHNHPIPTVWPEVAGGRIDEELPTVRLPAEEIGTTDFVLTKNSKGRDLVLYRSGRFYLDYSRKDGKIVFRCSAVSGCRATVLLLPNKTLQVPEDFSHNHPAPSEVALDDDWSPPDPTLKSSEDDDEGTPDGMDPLSALPRIILHDGFQYRYVTRHPTEQSAFFRCCNFASRKHQCHASLYTDLTGVVIQTGQQPHNHEPGDYLGGTEQLLQLAQQQQQLETTDLVGTREYKIVKNWKNRDVLVFQNCRYFLHYVRKDGRKVWRCSAIRSCHAAVYLNADGTVDQFRGQHVHEIRPEGEPRRRRRRRKAELMFPFGLATAATAAAAAANHRAAVMAASMFANGHGGGMVTPAELLARSAAATAAVAGGNHPVVNGCSVGGSPSSSSSLANGTMMTNGGGGGTGNEWIDYSDYGLQMGGGSLRVPEENGHSFWEQFHSQQQQHQQQLQQQQQQQQQQQHTSDGTMAGEGEAFDFSYHSVFGHQDSFNSYTVHALAQHHLQQQLQQHQQRMLLNGGHQQQQPKDDDEPQVVEDSSDEEEEAGAAAAGDDDDDDDDPMIVPEVKIESGDEDL